MGIMNKEFTVYVGNLPFDCSERDIEAILEAAGFSKDESRGFHIHMVRDRETDKFKGYCYIDVDNAEQVDAILKVDRYEFANRPLRVDRSSGQGRGGRSGGPPSGPGAGGGSNFQFSPGSQGGGAAGRPGGPSPGVNGGGGNNVQSAPGVRGGGAAGRPGGPPSGPPNAVARNNQHGSGGRGGNSNFQFGPGGRGTGGGANLRSGPPPLGENLHQNQQDLRGGGPQHPHSHVFHNRTHPANQRHHHQQRQTENGGGGGGGGGGNNDSGAWQTVVKGGRAISGLPEEKAGGYAHFNQHHGGRGSQAAAPRPEDRVEATRDPNRPRLKLAKPTKEEIERQREEDERLEQERKDRIFSATASLSLNPTRKSRAATAAAAEKTDENNGETAEKKDDEEEANAQQDEEVDAQQG